MAEPIPPRRTGKFPAPRPLPPERVEEFREDIEEARERELLEQEQKQEEAAAKQYSTPTRMLGWAMIAGGIFLILSDLMLSGLGILVISCGRDAREGSRKSLYLSALLVVLLAFIGASRLVPPLIHGVPLELDDQWLTPNNLAFWTRGVSPPIYWIGTIILLACAIWRRKLPFFGVVKVLTLLGGVGMLIMLGIQIRDMLLDRRVRSDFAAELEAARTYLKAAGSPSSARSESAMKEVFDAARDIHYASWKSRPFGGDRFYERKPPAPALLPGPTHNYQEWLKTPSGQWGKIELEVVLPESP